MAVRIAAVGNAEIAKWDTGLTKGATRLLSRLTEVRCSPFYTYDLVFEALVDTRALQRFQHIVTKVSMFWLKFQGDPETDEYRYQQPTYFDKTVTTLWSAIEVAELTGKTAQKVPPKDPERRLAKVALANVAKEARARQGRRKLHLAGCSRMASVSMARIASSSTRTARERGHLSGRCCLMSWWTARQR